MIEELRKEYYFGENSPLICDENGGVTKTDGTVKSLTVKQAADLLGHSTTQVTEMHYVKKDTSMLYGITNDLCL